MNPETKELLDYLLAFAGPGAAGGVALAIFGWLKARSEKPHIASSPTVGSSALAQIGGMVMGQSDLRDLIEAMRAIAASHDRCTLMRETEMELARKLARERREHESSIADVRHDEWRQVLDAVRTLNDRLRELRPS